MAKAKQKEQKAITVYQRPTTSTDGRYSGFEEVACYMDHNKYIMRLIGIAGFYSSGQPRYTVFSAPSTIRTRQTAIF